MHLGAARLSPLGELPAPTACHAETNKAALCVGKGEEKQGIVLLGTDRQVLLS